MACMFSLVLFVCCVGSGLCDGLITRSEESYRVCVCVCLIMSDMETSIMRRPELDLGCSAPEIKKKSEQYSQQDLPIHQ
jgi:hypothetical protein